MKAAKSLFIKPSAKKSSPESPIDALIQQAKQESRSSLNLRAKLIQTELPKSVTLLTGTLTSLILSDNELTVLPDILASFVNLLSLDVSSNKLADFPGCVLRLPMLTELMLSNNMIKFIPDTIVLMKNLDRLDASRNKIEKITSKLADMANLRELDLSNNEITTLPQEFAYIQKVKVLEVSNNPITIPPRAVVEKGLEAIVDYFRHKSVTSSSESLRSQNGPLRSPGGYSDKGVRLSSHHTTSGAGSSYGLNSRVATSPATATSEDVESAKSYTTDLDFALAALGNSRFFTNDSSRNSRFSLGIEDKFLAENLYGLATSLNRLRDARKIIVDTKLEAIKDEIEQPAPLDQLKSTDISFYDAYQISSSALTEKLGRALRDYDAKTAKDLVNERNRLKVDLVKSLAAYVETFLSEKSSDKKDENSADLKQFEAISTKINNQMKHTNELAQQLFQSVMEEISLIEENRDVLFKCFKLSALSDSRRNNFEAQSKRPSKKLTNFISMVIANYANAETPGELNALMKAYKEIATKFDSQSKLLAAQNADPTIVTTQQARKYEVNLAFQLETVSKFLYPEVLLLNKDVYGLIRANSTWPLINYRMKDYKELILADRDGSFYIGVNPFGHQCVLRKFHVLEKNRPVFEAIVKAFCSANHPNVGNVHGFWFAGDEAFVEEEMYHGVSLRDWMFKDAQTSFNVSRSIILQILKALSCLHRKNIYWGNLATENVVLVTDEFDELVPILHAFDFSFDSKLTDSSPPEAVELGHRVFSGPADLFHLGCIMAEAFSPQHNLPRLQSQSGEMIVPSVSTKLNSKNLPSFLRTLLRVHPEKRTTAPNLLLHPYFTVDSSAAQSFHDEPEKGSKLEKYLLHLQNLKRHSPGVYICEIEVGDLMLDQFFLYLESMSPEEYYKSLVFIPYAPNDRLDVPFLLLKHLVASELFIPVSVDFSETRPTSYFMPNASYQDVRQFSNVGKLLAKFVVDGFSWTPVFPIMFYKMLLKKPVTLEDLEFCLPKKAIDIDAKHELENVERAIEFEACQPFRQPMEIISQVFLECLDVKSSLSVYDLLSVTMPDVVDGLNHSMLLKMLVFRGFLEESLIPAFFKTWIESLQMSELRKFLLFATSSYTIPPGTPDGCSQEFYILEREPPMSIYIHGCFTETEQKHPAIERTFVNNIYVSSDLQDYETFQKTMSETLLKWMHDQHLTA